MRFPPQGIVVHPHEWTHILGGTDDIDAALNALALALANQGDIPYRAAALNTLAALAPGTAGQLLTTGGAGANPAWSWEHLLDNLPDASDTGNGLTTVDTVGEDVDPGEICFLAADGKYWLSDADSAAQMPAKVMAMESILADAAGRLLHIGYFRHDAWTWAWVAGEGNLLFADTTPGAMVQFAAKPNVAGDQVQVVGYVVTEDIVFFNPSYELVEIS